MNRLKLFLEYLQQQVDNHSIYVWGGQGRQGRNVTEEWIRKKETSPEYADRAVAFWKKQVSAGYGDVLRAFDCSGLGMFFLQNTMGIVKTDLSANGLYIPCTKIDKSELRPGDFVFNLGSTGKATHIGYVVDNALNVIEARGRDYGVVKRALSKGNWKAYGRPSYWTDEEVKEVLGETVEEKKTSVICRMLKYGSIGQDVCELKRLLAGKGYTGLTFTNPNYYSLTKAIVIRFQTDNGLVPDGIVGPLTLAALMVETSE